VQNNNNNKKPRRRRKTYLLLSYQSLTLSSFCLGVFNLLSKYSTVAPRSGKARSSQKKKASKTFSRQRRFPFPTSEQRRNHEKCLMVLFSSIFDVPTRRGEGESERESGAKLLGLKNELRSHEPLFPEANFSPPRLRIAFFFIVFQWP
jgi:hypothetical protein